MKKFNKRKLSDNEYSYKLFEDVANPFFFFFLECEYVDLNLFEENINKVLYYFKELQCYIKKKEFLYKKQSIKIVTINKAFTGYNFENLDFLYNKSEKLLNIYHIKDIHKRDVIVFKISHCLMDGKGFMVFLKSLLDFYRNNKVYQYSNCFISDLDFIKDLPTKNEKRKLSYSNKLKIKSDIKKDKIYIKRLTINRNIPFILSKIINILNDYYINTSLTYLIPTNIRHYNETVITVSNLTEPLYLRCEKTDDWFTISKKMHKQLTERDNLNLKNINYGSIINVNKKIFNIAIRISEWFQKRVNRFITAGSITNMGIIDLSDYMLDEIKINGCFLVPLYQPLLPLSIEITENKNKTEIVLVSNNKFIMEENVNDFFDKLINIK